MRALPCRIGLVAAAALLASCQRSDERAPPAVDVDPYSYAVGTELAAQAAPRRAELRLDSVHQAIDDAFKGSATMTLEQARELIRAYDDKHGAQRDGAARSAAARNLAEGQAFIDTAARREGVKRLPGGVAYEVLIAGEGPKPGETDQVLLHYVGRLADGSVFDDSHGKPVPVSVTVAATLPGWREVLPLMGVGSKVRVWVPGPLAFGESGLGTRVPPQAAVVFDLELLGIVH